MQEIGRSADDIERLISEGIIGVTCEEAGDRVDHG
jgi:hypothetical protein